jgi:hypothetical protein
MIRRADQLIRHTVCSPGKWQTQNPGRILDCMVLHGSQRSPFAPLVVVIRIPVVLAVIAFMLAACTASAPTQHEAGKRHPASPGATAATPANTAALARAGLAVPATYQQACANEAAICVQGAGGAYPSRPIPAVLNRPLHFPVVRPGQHCPASPGSRVRTADFGGTALGNGPVRVVIANTGGDLRHGVADLGPSSSPPWIALKTLWFSVPAYQGPFIIRARRLDHPGPVALGGAPTVAPLVVPPGPTLSGTGGWREAPGGLWVRTAGCYAWQVDGLTFSETIIVHAVKP